MGVMSALPGWSEKIDERGVPVDPLNANRSRNRVRNLFANGTITSITLRLRYASIFCWALDQLSKDADDRYGQLKNIEKLFGLASRYRQLQVDHGSEALRGMDGNSRFSYADEEFDEVQFDDLELLKNDEYAYSQFYELQLQSFLLKRGEFELTAAGLELADIVDAQIGDERDRILACARNGRANREDFEAIAKPFANQSLYLESECDEERQALQKVFMGFLEWNGDNVTGNVELAETFPEELSLDVLDHLHATIEEGELDEAGASKLYKKYNRGYHEYRAAHACFLCRSWQLQTEATDNRIALTEFDKEQFQQYRELMRLYWLQSYAGYAIQAQLEALCVFLNSRIPSRYDYESLLDQVTDEEKVEDAFSNLIGGLNTSQSSDAAAPSSVTRNLMLYGSAELVEPEVSVTRNESLGEMTVGQAVSRIEEAISGGWEAAPAVSGTTDLNEVLIGEALRNSLDGMSDHLDEEHQQFEYWTRSLTRSLALLFVTVSRFDQIRQNREWLYNYGYNRFDSPYTSLSELTRFVNQADNDTPLHEFARTLIDEKVVETHLQVFYSRLSPGNLKRAVSFDQDARVCLEVDTDRGTRPYASGVNFIRFDEMNTLLRDAGLLTESDDGYKPTDAGLDVLSRVVGVTDS